MAAHKQAAVGAGSKETESFVHHCEWMLFKVSGRPPYTHASQAAWQLGCVGGPQVCYSSEHLQAVKVQTGDAQASQRVYIYLYLYGGGAGSAGRAGGAGGAFSIIVWI